MDIFSRTITAPRIDLTIAIFGTLLSAIVGTTIGALVGFYSVGRGPRVWLSFAVMRAADVLQAFPVFVFAIALVAALGQSIQTVVLAIAFVNMPIYLRLVRSQVLSIRAMRYVEAAKVAGVSDITTIRRHIVPNAMAPVLAQLSAPTPEWGSMIAMGFQNVVTGQWWPSVFPGLSLAITVFGFSLVGASIEMLSDPARRQTLAQAMEQRNARTAVPQTVKAEI
jgi:peptide/nickel transport system permease protein